MEKTKAVIYVDPFGKEHHALVTAINGLNPGFASLVYVDSAAPEADNVKKLFDVAHISDPSKQETNPALPNYEVHCWKEGFESHTPLPADHPAFDHPFKQVEVDQDGARIEPSRPEYAAEVAAHQRTVPSVADLDAVAAEHAAAEATK